MRMCECAHIQMFAHSHIELFKEFNFDPRISTNGIIKRMSPLDWIKLDRVFHR